MCCRRFKLINILSVLALLYFAIFFGTLVKNEYDDNKPKARGNTRMESHRKDQDRQFMPRPPDERIDADEHLQWKKKLKRLNKDTGSLKRDRHEDRYKERKEQHWDFEFDDGKRDTIKDLKIEDEPKTFYDFEGDDFDEGQGYRADEESEFNFNGNNKNNEEYAQDMFQHDMDQEPEMDQVQDNNRGPIFDMNQEEDKESDFDIDQVRYKNAVLNRIKDTALEDDNNNDDPDSAPVFEMKKVEKSYDPVDNLNIKYSQETKDLLKTIKTLMSDIDEIYKIVEKNMKIAQGKQANRKTLDRGRDASNILKTLLSYRATLSQKSLKLINLRSSLINPRIDDLFSETQRQILHEQGEIPHKLWEIQSYFQTMWKN